MKRFKGLRRVVHSLQKIQFQKKVSRKISSTHIILAMSIPHEYLVISKIWKGKNIHSLPFITFIKGNFQEWPKKTLIPSHCKALPWCHWLDKAVRGWESQVQFDWIGEEGEYRTNMLKFLSKENRFCFPFSIST